MTLPQGMILAAGLGSRLDPLTRFVAKPALPFLNRPLLQYSLDFFHRAGICQVIVNLHHLPQTVRRAVDGFGAPMQVQYSREERILGTAGGIRRIRQEITSQTLVVSNGKIYFEEELSRALRFHRRSGAWSTLLLLPWRQGESYNPVFLDDRGRLTAFGKPLPGIPGQKPHIYTGVQILDRQALDLIPEGNSDSVKDLYPEMIRQGHPVSGFVSRSFWCECSWPERYLDMSLQVLRRRGLDNLGSVEGTDCRGVIAGDGVLLGRGCRLRDSILWPGTTIGRDTRLRRCIVAQGAQVPPGAQVQDAIVTPILDTVPASEPQARLGDSWIWPLQRNSPEKTPASHPSSGG